LISAKNRVDLSSISEVRSYITEWPRFLGPPCISRLTLSVCQGKGKGKSDKSKAVNRNPITEQRSVTCHVGSHSVSCHPTQVNAACLNPSQTGWWLILDLPTPGDRSLSLLTLALVM